MNLNYVGSLAERFMKFRASLTASTEVSENLFDAISIYVPKSLASNNISSEAYDASSVTSTTYAVIAVTVDNYKEIMKSSGKLFYDWSKVFNDDTNSAVTLYLIVFDDTTFSASVTDTSISWAPLTKAFEELYFISFFKVMFSEHYDGTKVTTPTASAYDDSNYFDMCLCLSALCAGEANLSACICEVHVTVPATASTSDGNPCKVLSKSRATETAHCTTLTGSTLADRAEYFWGYVNFLGGEKTMVYVHNGSYVLPIIFGLYFAKTNGSGQFVGNKLAKVRISDSRVKPTGLPSTVDSDVNLNLISAWYNNLDEKNVGYLISISGSSRNNAELITDRSVANYPIMAYMIKCWICYNASQSLADYASSVESSSVPVLTNEATYRYIQGLVQQKLNDMAGTGRLEGINLTFPPYSEAKQGNKFVGVAAWSARYIDDFGGCDVSGEITL